MYDSTTPCQHHHPMTCTPEKERKRNAAHIPEARVLHFTFSAIRVLFVVTRAWVFVKTSRRLRATLTRDTKGGGAREEFVFLDGSLGMRLLLLELLLFHLCPPPACFLFYGVRPFGGVNFPNARLPSYSCVNRRQPCPVDRVRSHAMGPRARRKATPATDTTPSTVASRPNSHSHKPGLVSLFHGTVMVVPNRCARLPARGRFEIFCKFPSR
jgi:hypothetical protein